ncbi:hypothetical protein LOK49_LG08G01398 [Camellia lanceoleosa]|uniref:Uncharacterized protein n=1 Tax=Camellia lanceoleosa TaxID=1840588 RepID=A0ACC0GTG3_9ERIC|nr:hypothetical protein LOK49_LG08G01398 [Camellia lanceoleosa]
MSPIIITIKIINLPCKIENDEAVVFQKNPLAEGPSTSTSAVADSEEAFPDVDDDNDELDLDELNELEASLSRTSIRIQEPSAEISS